MEMLCTTVFLAFLAVSYLPSSHAGSRRLHGISEDISHVFNASMIEQSHELRRKWSKNNVVEIDALINDMVAHPKTGGADKHVILRDERLFDALGPVVPACAEPLESYGKGDGEKRICGLSKLIADGRPCVIYSVGCNNQWDFEEAIVANPLTAHCTIETFDCTVAPDLEPPEHIRHRVRLHKYCLGKEDRDVGGKPFISYDTLHRMVDGKGPPTFLKMDIEGWEWDVLPAVINSNSPIPQQIGFELHCNPIQHISWSKRFKTAAEVALLMELMWHYGGYHLIDRRDNHFCGSCSEVLMANLGHGSHV